MATVIDNITLDETNVEFNFESDFVKHTERLVYLKGKADADNIQMARIFNP